MNRASARPLWRGRALAVVGIVLFAFSLRSAVASLSPLIEHIQADFALSAVAIGLMGTAPPACYALFGIVTPGLERRFGPELLTVVALAVVVAGTVARGLAVDSLTLMVSTVVVFAGIGVGNILLPPLVKRHFPDRLGLMMSVYTTTMAVSTFVPPLFAVPVADAVGWRLSMGMWAVFALVGMVPWIVMVRRARTAAVPGDVDEASPRALGRMWRLPLPWVLTGAFAVSGTLAYAGFAWLPVVLIDAAGVAPAEAALMLSVFAFVGFPCALIAPALVVRYDVVRLPVLVSVVCGIVGLGGLAFVPAAAPWLWVILYGMTAMFFPLTLVLVGVRARTHEGAVALSAFVQSLGYGIVALFPVGLGMLHDLTHAWTLPLLVLIGVALVGVPTGMVAARANTVEDEWERRHGAWSEGG
ncbi:CynX/NimT family MFS transporter [Microbacterium sp.]|uniref:MFS transporter n=1 Tax=Microbacterium sp. TaxID=51671 RepID=UPI0039E3936F